MRRWKWTRYVAGVVMVATQLEPAHSCTMPISRPETEIEIEVELEDYDDVRDRLIYKIEIESNVFPPTQTTQCQCVLGFGSNNTSAPASFDVTNALVAVVNDEEDGFDLDDFGGFERDDAVEASAGSISGFRAGATAYGFSTLVDPFNLPAPRPGDRLVLAFQIEFDPDDYAAVNRNAIQFLAGSNEPGHLLTVFPGYQPTLTLPPLPPLPAGPCDFNADGGCDLSDLNELLAQGPLTEPIEVQDEQKIYDLHRDRELDLDDVAAWLTDAAGRNGLVSPYRFGDANLDGVVDVADFNLWNSNKGYDSIYWDEGDFNADGVVNAADLLTLRSNLFASSFEAVATVPEPAACCFTLSAGLFAVGRRRRRRS